jgi:diketogulonate reductase-like aldo/keto reductase
VLPKSIDPTRIAANANLFHFSIPPEDMDALNALNQDHHFCWDPSGVA